jgi:hypothetical protein
MNYHTNSQWLESLRSSLIQSVEIRIGGQLVDRFESPPLYQPDSLLRIAGQHVCAMYKNNLDDLVLPIELREKIEPFRQG